MNSNSAKKILITGGFGYVGSRLTPLLLEQGYAVSVYDLNLYGDYGLEALKRNARFIDWEKKFEYFRNDIRDSDSISKALKGVDVVIHLAAISNDPTGDVDEVLTRQVNFDAVGMLLRLAKASGVKRFINASSSSVYGARSEANINEELEPEPITYYSKYKMLSEWLVLSAATPSFCAVNIRPATICGFSPRQRLDLTVNKLAADAMSKNIITVHGGSQRRPNVGMTDVINLYSRLIEIDSNLINGNTFNFGFENLTVMKIAELVQGQLGGESKVKIVVTDTKDIRDYHISSEKILNLLNYRPVSSIAAEVENLRTQYSNGHCREVDHPDWYNMRSMKLARNPGCYAYLSRNSI